MDGTLYHACGLSDVVTHFSFNSATSHHPLKFIATPNDHAEYRVFIGHDFLNGRVVEGVRPNNFADHTSFALVGPGTHLSFTWAAKSLADDFINNEYVSRYPELAEEVKIYDGLKKFTGWKVPLKAFHKSPWMIVDATINTEPTRYFDNVMSCAITKEQFDKMVAAVQRFQEKEKYYQATGLVRPNCHRFAGRILKAGGVRVPFWWGKLPWPAIDAFLLDKFAGKGCPRLWGRWTLQSSSFTAHLQEELNCQPQPTVPCGNCLQESDLQALRVCKSSFELS